MRYRHVPLLFTVVWALLVRRAAAAPAARVGEGALGEHRFPGVRVVGGASLGRGAAADPAPTRLRGSPNAICQAAVEHPHTVADSDGYTCSHADWESSSGCCSHASPSAARTRHDGAGDECDAHAKCCAEFPWCVAACVNWAHDELQEGPLSSGASASSATRVLTALASTGHEQEWEAWLRAKHPSTKRRAREEDLCALAADGRRDSRKPCREPPFELTAWDYCLQRCRTNGRSNTGRSNEFRSRMRFCFGEVDSPQETHTLDGTNMPPPERDAYNETPGSAPALSQPHARGGAAAAATALVQGRAGASCDEACSEAGRGACVERALGNASSCAAAMAFFGCSAGCYDDIDGTFLDTTVRGGEASKQHVNASATPAMVEFEVRGTHWKPGACAVIKPAMRNATSPPRVHEAGGAPAPRAASTCWASDKHLMRLCACEAQ